MDTLEGYPDHPLTTTRMIAWDSPSNWDTSSSSPQSSSTTTTSQPLTENNLSAYVDAQSSTFADSKNDILTRYYSSMKNNHFEALRLPPKSTNSNKYNAQSSTSVTGIPTKNVAIDAYPLPFPYHNDCTFLPTVETGRTRFDSESTQSLYDNQPSSPTLSAFSSGKRHVNSASRGNPSPNLSPSRNILKRYRRGSNVSHHSTITTATGTTTTTGVTHTSKTEHHQSITAQQQQQRRNSSFKSTKTQLNTLISNVRHIPSGAQRRLSLILVDGNKNMTTSNGIEQQQPSLDQHQQPHYLSSSSKKAIYGQHRYSSSPSLSMAALYDYYQGSSIPSQQHRLTAGPNIPTSLSTAPSSSPPPSPVTTYTYTTDSDMPTVISSSTFPRESVVWQNQLVYMASPSDQYRRRYNKPTPCLPGSQRKEGFFARFARKIWPFRNV